MAGIAAFVGAHGTGKTTMFEYIRARYSGQQIAFIPDVARTCPYKVGIVTSLQGQLWILSEQLHQESVVATAVCDKCIIDQYAYFVYWYGRHAGVEAAFTPFLARYHLIIKFPPGPRFLIADNLRPDNLSLQMEIDGIIENLLNYWNVPVERVPISDTDRRD